MGAAFRSEVLKLRKRPALWVLCALAIGDVLFFVYFLGYGYYVQVQAGVVTSTVGPDVLLRSLLTDQVVRAMLNQSGNFLAVGVILGALAAGSEYGWGTLKTVLTAGRPRLAVYGAQLLVLAVLLAVLVPAIFLATAGTSLLITALQHQPIQWPRQEQVLGALGDAYLIFAMATALGAMLATLFRSASVGIGLGLGLFYVISPTLDLFFGSSVIQGLIDWLPDDNAYSLITLFGPLGGGPYAVAEGPARGDAAHFALVLVLYTVASVVLGAFVYRRRDVVV